MDIEKKTKYKIAGQVSKANDDGSIKFHLITDDVDRDSEVLMPDGARLDNWKSNPVWLWAHNIEAWGGLERPPIGKINTNTIEQTEHFLAVDVMFDEKNDEFAKMVANKHRDGFLNATSVGFIPKVIGEDPVRPGQRGKTFLEYEVLEGSSVPIPANPAALQQNNWGGFVDDCKKYGMNNIGMKSWLKMAGWTDEEIKDALSHEQLRINIPYETNNLTTAPNCQITDATDGEETEKQKSNDSETEIEVDEEKISDGFCEISLETVRVLEKQGLSINEAWSAVTTAILDAIKAPEKDDTFKLILDELNSINIYTEPDASAQILTTLEEIGNTLKP
jgi:hypothetical protein